MQDFPGGPVVKTLPSNAGGMDSILDQGAEIPHASQPKNQNIKKKLKQYCNKFNKDLKKKKKKKKNQSELKSAFRETGIFRKPKGIFSGPWRAEGSCS